MSAVDLGLAKALAGFSLGLGLAEVAAPRLVARLAGVRVRPLVVRLLGLREIAAGAAILARPSRAGPVWSRVAGDAIDLGFLGLAFGSRGTDRARCGAATAAVLGVTALDILGAARLARGNRPPGFLHAKRSVAINRTPAECYAFWRRLGNLATFMRQVVAVVETSDTRSHWSARGPGGLPVEWDAEIVRDDEDALIEWQSIEGSQVETRGVVEFQPHPTGRGTIVRVAIAYGPPAGKLGALFAKASFEDPAQTLKEDLRRLKAALETGEVPTTEGQPHGPREVVHRTLARWLTGGVS
ncbi:MAG TPA: SRPBCC family protein [Planctomycetota bacterium]|nr:SRPBCC family protein [Planctomycetota bacterium]